MRSPTKTIWKTVVFAAAMLGGSTALEACKHHDGMMIDPCKDKKEMEKEKQMHPEGGDPYGGDPYGGAAYGQGAWGDDGSGYGNPDDGRSRGGDGDGEGSSGRGFVLS